MLSNPGLGSAHLCEVLCMIRKVRVMQSPPACSSPSPVPGPRCRVAPVPAVHAVHEVLCMSASCVCCGHPAPAISGAIQSLQPHASCMHFLHPKRMQGACTRRPSCTHVLRSHSHANTCARQLHAQIAFTSACSGKEQELLEPSLLPTLASMLQSNLPRPALLRALKVLKLCTNMCGPQHLPSWNLVSVFGVRVRVRVHIRTDG